MSDAVQSAGPVDQLHAVDHHLMHPLLQLESCFPAAGGAVVVEIVLPVPGQLIAAGKSSRTAMQCWLLPAMRSMPNSVWDMCMVQATTPF
jgi:hypothetical protein